VGAASKWRTTSSIELSYLVYHIVLHTRKPNFLFSMQICTSNSHAFIFATLFSCLVPFSVFMHGRKNEEPTSIASQFIVTLSPSGFRSSSFITFWFIGDLIKPFKFHLQHVLWRHVKICAFR